jgi:hypothetical protein
MLRHLGLIVQTAAAQGMVALAPVAVAATTGGCGRRRWRVGGGTCSRLRPRAMADAGCRARRGLGLCVMCLVGLTGSGREAVGWPPASRSLVRRAALAGGMPAIPERTGGWLTLPGPVTNKGDNAGRRPQSDSDGARRPRLPDLPVSDAGRRSQTESAGMACKRSGVRTPVAPRFRRSRARCVFEFCLLTPCIGYKRTGSERSPSAGIPAGQTGAGSSEHGRSRCRGPDGSQTGSQRRALGTDAERRLVSAVIGICPLAVMRLCPETATPITKCDCAWSCGCS